MREERKGSAFAIHAAMLGLLLLGPACKRDDLGYERSDYDASPGLNAPPPAAVSVHDVPSATPLASVKVAGTTSAQRVIIRGGPVPIVADVLPNGAFCADVPLPERGDVTLELLGLDGRGGTSQMVMVPVRRDSGANAPASPYCSGLPRACASREVCGNGKDDDCNGKADARDPACPQICDDDPFEPNDDKDAAHMVELGNYSSIKLCASNEDWYTVRVQKPGQKISVVVNFNHSAGDLSLFVYSPAGAIIGSSASTSNTERVDLPGMGPGYYQVRIKGATATAGNIYNLSLQVQ